MAGPDAFCPVCGFRLDDVSGRCLRCSSRPPERFPETGPLPAGPAEGGETTVVFRSLSLASFSLYAGVLGLFLGILTGALTGATSAFPGFVSRLPQFFIGIQGKMLGTLIYAGVGAVLGFGAAALAGLTAAVLLNLASYFVGGFRVRLSGLKGKSGRGGET